MGRRCYVLLRSRHNVPIRCRTTETSWRRSTETSLGVSFRRNCDIAGTYSETSLRRCYDIFLPGGIIVETIQRIVNF